VLDLPLDLPGDIGIFLILEGCPLIWIKAATDDLGAESAGKTSRALDYG
jgi:hypothetical protein